jgi:hypothetical protein
MGRFHTVIHKVIYKQARAKLDALPKTIVIIEIVKSFILPISARTF